MAKSESDRRVVVTGLGTVTAAGTDLDAFWAWLCAPVDGPVLPGPITEMALAALHPKERRRHDEFAGLAIGAAELALTDAGDPNVEPSRAGVVLAAAYGAIGVVDREREVFRDAGPSSVSPYLSVAACENIPASILAQRRGFRGPAKAVVGACASGAYAIGDAADLIRSDRADLVVVVGSQAPLTPTFRAAYEAMRVLSPSGWLRPFDRRRDGFVLAHAGAAMILEDFDAAHRRGAVILAEVLGAANTNDGASLVAPSGPGAAECVRAALADAHLSPHDIAHLNAHGTGTPANDIAEAMLFHEIFGDRPPPVTSVKRATGHSFAAAGVVEGVAAVLSITRATIPPVGIDVEPDPSAALDLVIGAPRPWTPGPVLSTSFGLGGHNGCVIFGPPTAHSMGQNLE